MSSGVSLSEEGMAMYQALKVDRKYKWIKFKLNPSNTEIIVDTTSAASSNVTYESFIESLENNEPRWIVYDWEYDLGESGKRNKIILISWSPDGASIKSKMVFASSSQKIKSAFDSSTPIQASSKEDLDPNEITRKLPK